MMKFEFEQPLGQLVPRKGGYYYLKIGAEIVEQFPRKRATRLICEIDDQLSFGCGLNHYGDGNFFIIVSGKNVKKLDKSLGDLVSFVISEDPNPLGVAIPEVLQVLMDQDTAVKDNFDLLTDGKKRSLIYTIMKIKDIDKQISKVMDFLEEERMKRVRKARK